MDKKQNEMTKEEPQHIDGANKLGNKFIYEVLIPMLLSVTVSLIVSIIFYKFKK